MLRKIFNLVILVSSILQDQIFRSFTIFVPLFWLESSGYITLDVVEIKPLHLNCRRQQTRLVTKNRFCSMKRTEQTFLREASSAVDLSNAHGLASLVKYNIPNETQQVSVIIISSGRIPTTEQHKSPPKSHLGEAGQNSDRRSSIPSSSITRFSAAKDDGWQRRSPSPLSSVEEVKLGVLRRRRETAARLSRRRGNVILVARISDGISAHVLAGTVVCSGKEYFEGTSFPSGKSSLWRTLKLELSARHLTQRLELAQLRENISDRACHCQTLFFTALLDRVLAWSDEKLPRPSLRLQRSSKLVPRKGQNDPLRKSSPPEGCLRDVGSCRDEDVTVACRLEGSVFHAPSATISSS
ncbi:hypothetical protein F2Q70_00027630 [Brassica cretica]|uniref:Uncharacterized protein n=1 Tax=Brassica cretica TaxID=69181 RepID=A0A8S9LGB6_BRACR|nr:hypothetical protein F2Q70_00027630 [Brassica cretica]